MRTAGAMIPRAVRSLDDPPVPGQAGSVGDARACDLRRDAASGKRAPVLVVVVAAVSSDTCSTVPPTSPTAAPVNQTHPEMISKARVPVMGTAAGVPGRDGFFHDGRGVSDRAVRRRTVAGVYTLGIVDRGQVQPVMPEPLAGAGVCQRPCTGTRLCPEWDWSSVRTPAFAASTPVDSLRGHSQGEVGGQGWAEQVLRVAGGVIRGDTRRRRPHGQPPMGTPGTDRCPRHSKWTAPARGASAALTGAVRTTGKGPRVLFRDLGRHGCGIRQHSPIWVTVSLARWQLTLASRALGRRGRRVHGPCVAVAAENAPPSASKPCGKLPASCGRLPRSLAVDHGAVPPDRRSLRPPAYARN